MKDRTPKVEVLKRYPEINYVILRRDATYLPFVAAFRFDDADMTWGQGHYFGSYEDAKRYVQLIRAEKVASETGYRYLSEFFPDWVFSDEEDKVEFTGADNKLHKYTYKMTLSPRVPDDACMRIRYQGRYYYFG